MNKTLDKTSYQRALVGNIAEAVADAGRIEGETDIFVDNGILTEVLVSFIAQFAAVGRPDRRMRRLFVDKVSSELSKGIVRQIEQMSDGSPFRVVPESEVH